MDGAGKRKSSAGRRAAAVRGRRSGQKSRGGGEHRRLAQLLVSLSLFLLVYLGRGVFPEQLAAWKQLLCSDVDFSAAFSQFGEAVSRGDSVQSAFEELCVVLLGGEGTGTQPERSAIRNIKPLSQSERLGLNYAHSQGLLALTTREKEEPLPAPSLEPTPEPTPEIVTAVAQEYTAGGEKLPRNVSFAYYELGLSETAVPVMGTVTSGFGYRDSPTSGKHEFHLAMDIGASEGTEIGAFAAGVVEYIGQSDEFGLYLKIKHDNGVSSFYAHCSKLLVQKGESVTCGQTVALVGETGNATGPHLHLTIEKDNIRLNPAYYVEIS